MGPIDLQVSLADTLHGVFTAMDITVNSHAGDHFSQDHQAKVCGVFLFSTAIQKFGGPSCQGPSCNNLIALVVLFF